MIPDCHRRLTIAHADLSQILVRTAPFFLPGGGLKIIKSHGSNPRATVTKMDSVRKEETLRGTRLWRWSQSSFVLVAAGLSRCLVFWTSMSGVCVVLSDTLIMQVRVTVCGVVDPDRSKKPERGTYTLLPHTHACLRVLTISREQESGSRGLGETHVQEEAEGRGNHR